MQKKNIALDINRRIPREKPQFRLKPAVVMLASIMALASQATHAADEQLVQELQAEIARLKQELASRNNPNSAAPEHQTTPQAQAAANPENADDSNNALGSVVVTARKQNAVELVQETPASVSAVTGEELQRLQATNITEVLSRIGNVNFNYGNPRTGSLTLRGITTGSSDQIDPTVGTILDGVSIAYTPLVNGYIFTDIETVDVTRGPQGTTGGKASNIGRITFKTKAPTFTPEAQVSQVWGDWGTLRSNAVAGGPVIDGLLAWRGTFVREQADGPFKNQFPDLKGRTSYQNTDRTFGRVQFLLTPTDNFSAKLSIEHQPKGEEFVNGSSVRHPEPTRFSDGTARNAASVDTTYKKYINRDWFNRSPTTWNPATDYYRYLTNTDNNGTIVTSSQGATLNLEWNVAGHLLQSITGYRNHWFSAANDEGTPYDITKSGGYITSYDQKSQEFRITSEPDGKRKFDYTAGIYFITTDNDSLSRTRYGNDAGAFQASDMQYNYLTSGGVDPTGTTANPLPWGTTTGALVAPGVGQALLRDTLNLAYKHTNTYVKNKSTALYGSIDWHITEPITVTTGYRFSQEDRETAQGVFMADNGVGADFTTAFGTGLAGGSNANANNLTPANTAAADRLASRYFGQGSTWTSLSDKEKNLLYRAAQIRAATLQPASLYNTKNADRSWTGNLNTANISLTDRLNEQFSVYGVLQYGEKAGIAQINNAGKSSLVDKEKTTGYELGFRSRLLDNTLSINADVFLNDIKDFQTTVNEYDPVTTATYRAGNPTVSAADSMQYQSLVGNLPGIRVKGLEVDAFYSGIPYTTIRLAAAYNDARYSKDAFLVKPNEESGTQRYYNAKGDTLNNAPKFTANLGIDYQRPVLGNYVLHGSANYRYTSSYQVSPSIYDEVQAYGLVDLGFGIGRKDGLFDVNFIAKNAFNQSYNVEGWSSYTPSLPRWIGVVLSSKLF